MPTVDEMSCQELVELVTDYLEGRLDERDRRRFDEHISRCGGCTAYLEQMRLTLRAVGALRVDDLEPRAVDELTRAFRDWTHDR